MEITKDTLISDILELDAEKAAPIFLGMGMHCLGCAAAHGETIGQACDVHGENIDELITKLKDALSK